MAFQLAGWQGKAAAAVMVDGPSALDGPGFGSALPEIESAPPEGEDAPPEAPRELPELPLPPDERPPLGAGTDETAPSGGEVDAAGLPVVHYGDADLPEPVRQLRAAILAAAQTGEISALAPLLGDGANPVLSEAAPVGDPVTYLEEISGDREGREILAILIDLLEAGWVVRDKGTPAETYVWPYFAELPIDRLTPKQMVELYRILTAADVDEMRAYGTWLFFRLTVAADGTWKTFLVPE